MKKFLLLIAVFIFTTGLFAQMPPGAMPGNGAMQAPGNIGHVYGKITDADGKPIGDASVMLMQTKMDTTTKKMKQVLVKGMITKSNGDFNFEELPLMGKLVLKISTTGYKAMEQEVSFMPKRDPAAATTPPAQRPSMPSFDKDLGNIKLTPDAKQLQDVVVTAVSPSVRLSGDKKIFNVEKNIMSAGGTGLDVLRNVPSVNVDIDGNVTMRNSAPQLLIDGRPTTLTIDQVPADAIESVEVITNPSAKYDASGGGAGILNIVLKKNKKTGYNGNLRAGVDKRGAINSGVDFNLRQNKINITAGLNYNQNKSRTTGTTDRINLLDVPQTSVLQNNYNRTQGSFLFGKLGLDYFITNRTTLSISAIKFHGEFNPTDNIDISTDSLYNNAKITSLSQRNTTGTRQFDRLGTVLGF